MSEENSEISIIITEIRDSWRKSADEYYRKELHSDEEFHNIFDDIASIYMKGVSACDNFFVHNDVDMFVTEIIELGFFYQAYQLSRFVISDELLKVISEIKEEFGFTNDEMEEECVC